MSEEDVRGMTCPSPTPCPTCPWRRDQPTDGHLIPGYSFALVDPKLAYTVGEGDEFRPIMACHQSREGRDYMCRGYVAVEGYTNLALRVMGAQGQLNFRDVWDACDPLDLYGSFQEMRDALHAGQSHSET